MLMYAKLAMVPTYVVGNETGTTFREIAFPELFVFMSITSTRYGVKVDSKDNLHAS